MKYEIVVRERSEGFFESEACVWESEEAAEEAPMSYKETKMHYTTTEARGVAMCVGDLLVKGEEFGK